jgi:hypothetical protein
MAATGYELEDCVTFGDLGRVEQSVCGGGQVLVDELGVGLPARRNAVSHLRHLRSSSHRSPDTTAQTANGEESPGSYRAAAASTSADINSMTSRSLSPCSRTSDFHVENAIACPRTARVRRLAPPRRFRPVISASSAEAK